MDLTGLGELSADHHGRDMRIVSNSSQVTLLVRKGYIHND